MEGLKRVGKVGRTGGREEVKKGKRERVGQKERRNDERANEWVKKEGSGFKGAASPCTSGGSGKGYTISYPSLFKFS